jgi:hypothetical protein
MCQFFLFCLLCRSLSIQASDESEWRSTFFVWSFEFWWFEFAFRLGSRWWAGRTISNFVLRILYFRLVRLRVFDFQFFLDLMLADPFPSATVQRFNIQSTIVNI